MTMEEHFATARQPLSVDIKISGANEDLNEWFRRLYGWLDNQAASVDFTKKPGEITFHVHPFAIND